VSILGKSDLFDELRAEIGCVADGWDGDIAKLYQAICQLIHDTVEHYESVSIYLTKEDCFERKFHQGIEQMPQVIPYGEEELSIAALRGGLSCSTTNSLSRLCVPFYCGHHLVGEIVVITLQGGQLDDEDYTFFCELVSLMENKL
jgi:L-methionine (R)-S-oxide reductase